MKRVASTILCVAVLLSVVYGVSGCSRKPKDWYKSALEYYSNGIKNGFTEENRKLFVSDDLKDPYNTPGYLLTDLDGDGVDEMLIGLISDGSYTKFTNVVVYHSDLGPYCLLGGGNGYYIYLCAGNVLRVDSWYGSETKSEYMKWNSKDNAFNVIDGEGKYMPMKWELTAF